MISEMKSKWPTKRILIGKIDPEVAYLWIHTNLTTSSTCIAIVDELDFLCLRLPFGTTPTPAEYTTVSEAEIDLGNDLLRDESWDKDDLKSPQKSLIPQENKQTPTSHLVKAEVLALYITDTQASMDGLIDNIITTPINDKHWIYRT